MQAALSEQGAGDIQQCRPGLPPGVPGRPRRVAWRSTGGAIGYFVTAGGG